MSERILILSSGRCAWSKCAFCGWGKLESARKSFEDLKRVFDSRVESTDRLKIFNSGSFFDVKQFPREFWVYVNKRCAELNIKELVVESRPEFVSDEALKVFKSVKLFVAFGLEVASDDALRKLGKGVRLEQFESAVSKCRSNGVGVRAYVLVNPPFTDYPLRKTVDYALSKADELVLINTFPHMNTELFDEWIKGAWKPLSEGEFNEAIEPFREFENVEFEFNNFAFKPKFPLDKQVSLRGVSVELIDHPHYNVWQDYFVRFYKLPVEKLFALFIPCSARKPYRRSLTHKLLFRVLSGFPWFKKLHLLVVSSPGVIPYEFHNSYPFNAYDWPEKFETKEIMREYVRITKERVKAYLKAHEYEKVFVFMKPTSESYQAVIEACKDLKIKVIDCMIKKDFEEVKGKTQPEIFKALLPKLKDKLNRELGV